jgi:hypothetical protein
MEDASSNRGQEWDEVRTLFGGYLHQDFAEDYGDMWGAVRQYCAESSSVSVIVAAEQISEILEQFDDEERLDSVTGQLGSSYYPPGVGQTYREWMTELERFLRAASTAASSD